MPFQPLRDLVACIPIEDPDRTEAGLWVPEKAKQMTDQGIVKYTGPDVREVQRGDHVLFGGYGGDKLSLEDEGVLVIIPEDALTAVIPESTERIITETEALRFLEGTEARLKTEEYDFDEDTVDKLIEVFHSELTDFFYAEGLEF